MKTRQIKRVTLAIPHFEHWLANLRSDQHFPMLEKLLSRAEQRVHRFTSACVDEFSWRLMGGEIHSSDVPIAALSMLGEGFDPGDGIWCCVSPVHLKAEQRHLLMLPQALLGLDDATSRRYFEALKICFADEKYDWLFGSPTRWYLKLPVRSDIKTSALSVVEGQFVDQFLPSGTDRMRWASMLNNAQMCFHHLEFKSNNRQKSLVKANSAWFWGVGGKPLKPVCQFDHIWSDRPFIKGFAQQAVIPLHIPPGDGESMKISTLNAEKHLIILNKLCESHDIEESTSEQRLLSLENQWITPLIKKLQRKDVNILEVVTQNTSYVLTAANLRKFWRRNRALSTYI